MAETFVTQCPHCGTTFKVTSVHLSAANGSVRCGSCLKIFSAKNHLVTEKSANKKSEIDKRAPGNSRHPQQGTGMHSTASFSAIDTGEAESEPSKESDLEQFEPDESEDEFGFGEMSDEMTQVMSASQFDSSREDEPFVDSVDESWAKDMLEELKNEPKLKLDLPDQDELTEKVADEFDPDYLDGTVAIDAIEFAENPKLYDQIESVPLELDFEKISPHRWIWFLLSLFMLLLLAAQLAWFNMNSWSRLNDFRPFYQQFCDIAHCKLPPQVEISAIQTGNLVIRKDIKQPANLIVDAILINQAPYEQPFAQIILEFSDINGKLISDGLLIPEQYLSGELSGALLMPSRTPIHISFSVKNPGENAVNYNLRFK